MTVRLELARSLSAQCRELEHRLTELRPIHRVWIMQITTQLEPLPAGEKYTRDREACEAAIRMLIGSIGESEILFDSSVVSFLDRVVASAQQLLYLPRDQDVLDRCYDELAASIHDALDAIRLHVPEEPAVPSEALVDFHLKPSVFGVGINLNRVLGRVRNWWRRRRR